MLKLVKTVKTARFGCERPEPSGMAGGAGALQCARYGKTKSPPQNCGGLYVFWVYFALFQRFSVRSTKSTISLMRSRSSVL